MSPTNERSMDVAASGPAREPLYSDDDVSASMRIDGLAEVIAAVVADEELHGLHGPESEIEHAEKLARLKRFVVDYNEHFGRQHLERHPDAPLRAVNPFDAFIPRAPELGAADVMTAALAFLENIDEMLEQFEGPGRDLIEYVESGHDVLIVVNHLTFLSAPVVIAGLSELVRRDDPGKYEAFLDRMYILMNAATLTHEFFRDNVLSFANVFQTRSGVGASRLPAHSYTEKELAKRTTSAVRRIFDEPAGRFLLACPSGTTDRWEVDENGLAHVVMVQPSETTAHFFDEDLGHLAKLAVAVNEHEYLAERKSGDITGGRIHVHFGPLHPPGDPSGRTEKLMDELRTSIPDGRGGSVPAEVRPLDSDEGMSG